MTVGGDLGAVVLHVATIDVKSCLRNAPARQCELPDHDTRFDAQGIGIGSRFALCDTVDSHVAEVVPSRTFCRELWSLLKAKW